MNFQIVDSYKFEINTIININDVNGMLVCIRIIFQDI